MDLGSSLRELSGILCGLSYDDLYNSQHNNFSNFKVSPLPTNSAMMDLPEKPSGSSTSHVVEDARDAEKPEDYEIASDISLNYIRRMLMEEDIDEKVSMYQAESAALRAAAKPFYDILGEEYPPSPDRLPPQLLPPRYDDGLSLDSPGENSLSSDCTVGTENRQSYSGISSSGSTFSFGGGASDPVETFEEPLITCAPVPDFLIESFPAGRFHKGTSAPDELRREQEAASMGSRVRKNTHCEEFDLMEGKSRKQSALFSDESLHNDMFDIVLLNQGSEKANDLREKMRSEAARNLQIAQMKNSTGPKSRGRKQNKKEVVDLRTILIHCAQAVAADDQRTAQELLKRVRQHSSVNGDGTQRLAYCFADGLEARMAGMGSQIYQKLVAKRTTATDMLKAYHLFLAACPFKRVSHFVANRTILNAAEKASTLHIIDFGIYFGFQWPSLIQRLSDRKGGPPMLRITGIEVPQPGFRPTERVEETGRRLAGYAEKFGVPFKYQGIASKWEMIRVEDLNIEEDEVTVVNCLYRFRNLIDETVSVDSPRDRVLKTIREIKPAVFIHGILNGSYSVPFFVTRFREALFHFSALFDMLETTVPREDEQRLLIERDMFGREALNVIACEGSERVERPETYKQWQVRNLRAGFQQVPLTSDIVKGAKEKASMVYHKDFVIDQDSRWLLQGWKGRILYALSTWKPNGIGT